MCVLLSHQLKKTSIAAAQVDSWMQQAGRASGTGAAAVAEPSAAAAQDPAAAIRSADASATGLVQSGERCIQLWPSVLWCLARSMRSCAAAAIEHATGLKTRSPGVQV